jgi:hypothetical protein
MRRFTLLLVAALLVTAADSALAQKLTWGVRGGLNIATGDVQGEAFDQDVGTRNGFHAGLLGDIEVSKNFGIQMDALYTQKGFGKGNGDIALSTSYVMIPILFVAKLPGTVSPHLYLGPELSLETSCNASIAGLDDISCDDVRAETSDFPRTKGADSGIIFGLGIDWEVGFGILVIDAMYDYGLTNIAEVSEEIDHIKTRTFMLSLGLKWGIGGDDE